MSTLHSIYVLKEPFGIHRVRYVGVTTNSIRRRYNYTSPNGVVNDTPVGNWVLSLRDSGVQPEFEIIDVCDSAELADVAERKWIRKYRKSGRLFNVLDGGKGFDRDKRRRRRICAMVTPRQMTTVTAAAELMDCTISELVARAGVGLAEKVLEAASKRRAG